MGGERDSFWRLERINRRKTVELVAIFILIYCLLGFVLDLILHTFRVIDHRVIGFPWATALAAAIAALQALYAYYRGSSALIGLVGAEDLVPDSTKSQMVVDVVDEMALAARIPRPRLCLMDDPAPNAFAAGRDPAHSVICVTRGLVDQLDREELQGVIAHEIAHIRGHDTRITQMATVMVGGFGLVSGSIMRYAREKRTGEVPAIPGVGLVAVPLFIFSGIGWVFSKMTAIALSRQREYLADAAAVEFTRNPVALIRALEQIARIASPLKSSLRRLAPLFIVDPLECGGTGWTEILDGVSQIEAQSDRSKEERDAEAARYVIQRMPQNLFQDAISSHPPIHDRIMRLRGLLHDGSDAHQESAAEIRARRQAAAKTVVEATQKSPEAMAAVLGAMLTGSALKMGQALSGGIDPSSDAGSLEPEETSAGGEPAEQAIYRKLYEYNLGITGDDAPSQAAGLHPAGSPLEALLGGQSGKLDPDQLKSLLAAGIASAHQRRKTVPADAMSEEKPSKALWYLLWIVVIALSGGAIVAGLAVR